MDGVSRATAPDGTWASSLGAREVARAALGLSYATAYNGRLYWIESRPAEQGRSALMAAALRGPAIDVTPATSNVRSRVHEYGGRPYTVARNAVIFCEFADQRLWNLFRWRGVRIERGDNRRRLAYIASSEMGRR